MFEEEEEEELNLDLDDFLDEPTTCVTDNSKRRKKRKINEETADEDDFLNQLEAHDGAFFNSLEEIELDCLEGLSLDNEGNKLTPMFANVLKPHQVRGVLFLWQHIQQEKGCILADYMGLGKTIQNLSLIHAFLSYSPAGTTVLILAPSSVVRNWLREICKWMTPDNKEGMQGLQMFNATVLDSKTASNPEARYNIVSTWAKRGGVLIVGYELFRLLAMGDAKHKFNGRTAEMIKSPDLLIADEGHRLRQTKSQLVIAIMQMKTRRRIVLTGYPLQNHLEEYYCMVHFARPDFLGSQEQFKHRFVIPIENGQAMDSDMADVELARSRTFVLNEILKEIVLRRDSTHLAKDLPPKYEWLLRCKLTPIQAQLYRSFVRDKVRDAENGNTSTNGGIIAAYHHSLSIVNHPDILYSKLQKLGTVKEEQVESEEARFEAFAVSCPFDPHNHSLGVRLHSLFIAPDKSRAIFLEKPQLSSPMAGKLENYDELISVNGVAVDGIMQLVQDTIKEIFSRKATCVEFGVYRHHPTSYRYKLLSKQVSVLHDDGEIVAQRMQPEEGHSLKWASPLMKSYSADSSMSQSGKMEILFSILRESRSVGDKVIVFSQSVKTLDIIKRIIDCHNANTEQGNIYSRGKTCGYCRLDGSTAQIERNQIVDNFNARSVDSVAVFLASTRAAGEGLNLQSANRVVMFDVCWNPCLDHEAMCRAYRFGQQKPVFVYRLIAAGTMEKTIFDQQTKKESLTSRVVDARATKRSVTVKDLRDFFNLSKFNQLQKESIDHVVNSESDLSDEDMRTRKALLKDPALAAVLQDKGALITKFTLEDLLMSEDLSEKQSQEQQDKAMAEFNAQRDFEQGFVSQGFPPSVAAAMATSKLISSRNSLSIPEPSINQVAIQRPRIFSDTRFFVLRRRMIDSESLIRFSIASGARVYLEIHPTILPCYVISSWNTVQLETWRQGQKGVVDKYNEGCPENTLTLDMMMFKTREWVFECIDLEKIIPGGDPPPPSLSPVVCNVAEIVEID